MKEYATTLPKKLYWVRFFSVGITDEEKPLKFHCWVSGHQVAWGNENEDDVEIRCALVSAASERSAKAQVRARFWKPEFDSIQERPAGWTPGDRFPMYELRGAK